MVNIAERAAGVSQRFAAAAPIAEALPVDEGGPSISAPARAGAREVLPVLLGLAPLAITVGASVAASPVDNRIGWTGAVLVFGASPHLMALTMLGAGAAGVATVMAVLVLSARNVIYSAGMVSRMSGQPAWFRWTAPYFLVDPLYALVADRTDADHTTFWVRWYYLGAALAMWVMWIATIALGVLVGPLLGSSAALDFALPALLIAFLVPALRSRPALAAAVVGGLVGAAASGLPSGLGPALGAALGTAAAVLYERSASWTSY